jgi:2-methylisocitrate lyase-like PEP mutase family enzyme
MNQFETFLQLHRNETPLLLANIWDADSARLVEENGFKAIATSSGAMARAAGYDDGQNLPFDLLIDIVKRIQQNITIPFSVDIEKGYSDNSEGIIRNIERLYDIGISGVNIEDTAPNDKELQPIETFARTIEAVANHLVQKNKSVFINVRTDAFLLKLSNALEETEKRVKVYETTGLNGIFVPFIKKEDDIAAIVKATSLPINVLSMPGLPDFKTLAALGVKRISLGSSLHNAMKKELVNKLQAVQQEQSVRSLF